MNTTELICKQCQGNIIYNSETKTGVCSCCGRKTFYTDESIAENPYQSGYEWQKGVIKANEESKIAHSVQPISNNIQNINTKPSTPRKKSVVGRVFLVIGIIYTIMGMICFLINLILEFGASGRTTPSTSTIYIDDGNEEYGLDPIGSSLPRPIETTTELRTNEPKARRESLTSMEPYTYSPKGWGIPYKTPIYNVKDIFGNKYNTAIESTYKTSVGTASATFALNNEFSRLEFDLAVPDEDRGYEGEAEIYIYNGTKLIFEERVRSDMRTKHVVLPLENCTDLTIELYSCDATGIYDLSVMMCDPFLYR